MLTGGSTLAGMSEGAKLLEVLTTRGLTVQMLATACNVTWPAANRYVTAKIIGPKAWLTVAAGLRKLGIDPREIRSTATEEPVTRPNDLRPQIDGMTAQQLRAVKAILEADAPSRERLLWIVEDRLDRAREGEDGDEDDDADTPNGSDTPL